jgi:hypothetical protein
MTKRRTIEIILETEELLLVNQRRRLISLKCSECGGPVEPLALAADAAGSRASYDRARELRSSDSSLRQNGEGSAAREDFQVDTFALIRRLLE